MSDTNVHEEITGSFLDNILTPGSSFQNNFLLILDVAFTALLSVLLSLIYLTSGNIHLFFLIIIELCLWASIKWFVAELRAVKTSEREKQS